MTTNQQGPGERPRVAHARHEARRGLPDLPRLRGRLPDHRALDRRRADTSRRAGRSSTRPGPAAQTYTPQGGTLVSKPVVDERRRRLRRVHHARPDRLAGRRDARPPLHGRGQGRLHRHHGVQGLRRSTQTPAPTSPRSSRRGDRRRRQALRPRRRQDEGRPDRTPNLWLFTSTDGGQTWSAADAGQPARAEGERLPGDRRRAGARARSPSAGSARRPAATPTPRTTSGATTPASRSTAARAFAYTTVTPDPSTTATSARRASSAGSSPASPATATSRTSPRSAVDPATAARRSRSRATRTTGPTSPTAAEQRLGSSAYFARQTDAAACFTRGQRRPAAAGAPSCGPGPRRSRRALHALA